MVPQNCCSSLAGAGFLLCEQHFPTCSVPPVSSPPQRDENPVGADTSLVPHAPHSVLNTGNTFMSYLLFLDQQQCNNSRLKHAQSVISIHPGTVGPSPLVFVCCVLHRHGLGQVRAASSTNCNHLEQSLLWNLYFHRRCNFIIKGVFLAPVQHTFIGGS